VPPPSLNDAATGARFELVDGQRDRNGGELDVLHDARLPLHDDAPSQNFFFAAGTDGGRLRIDLEEAIEIARVNTYSWHPNTRGPQVYTLFASDGTAEGFDPVPARGVDPEQCGWTRIATVNTRPTEGEGGGQHGVSISNSDGGLGTYRHLLFDILPTEDATSFGNTFYSEIDVIERGASVLPVEAPELAGKLIELEAGKYRLTIDTSVAPDLSEWAEQTLAPIAAEWYPRIVEMLPGEGYEAPERVMIRFRDGMGGTPASAGGNRVNCNPDWFRRNLDGEAAGSVVHELVHVVQNYGRGRRNNPDATRTPGWLVEGIADYIRWFLYEPETRGAEITARNLDRARYDASYRITGNFLNWVTEAHDRDIVAKLNAAAREGRYREELWVEHTGRTVQQLGDEWKDHVSEAVSQ
jgi:hypothetical protein